MKAKRILALVTLVLIVIAIWMVNNKSGKMTRAKVEASKQQKNP